MGMEVGSAQTSGGRFGRSCRFDERANFSRMFGLVDFCNFSRMFGLVDFVIFPSASTGPLAF